MKSQLKLVVALSSLSVLVACDPEVVEPPVNHPAPVVERAAPNLIAVGGGTLVRVYGQNFQEGLQLFVGSKEATEVTWISSMAFIARIPSGTADAAADLRVVNPDQKAAVLPNGIRYDVQPSITDARMTMADPAEFFSAGESVVADIRGALFVPTETGTTGRYGDDGSGQGVRAQVAIVSKGTSVPTQEQFSGWIEASFEADSFTPGMVDWDVYKGSVTLPPTSGRTMLEYFAVVRFSVDDGATWLYADKDGIANGWSGAQLPQVRTGGRRPEWCKTNDIGSNSPMTITYSPGQTASAVVRGQVNVSGVTNGSGRGTGVEMEIGYGPEAVDPASWSWSPATYSADLFNVNDEFTATLPNPSVSGDYRWAFRASVAGGPYRYCDVRDTTDFSVPLGTNHLSVTGSTPSQIDWCKLGPSSAPETPPTIAYAVGVTGDAVVKALIYEDGITNSAGPPSSALQVWLGYGPPAEDPSSGAWTWTAASFVEDRGENDEFQATLANPAGGIGNYKFAYRAQVNGGAYAYCDSDGLAIAGFTAAQAGNLNVVPQCALGSVSTSSVQSGTAMTVVGTIDCPSCSTIVGEAGVGPRGSDATSAAGWSWRPGTSSAGTYTATIAPAISGDRDVSFRFKTNLTGDAYFYCDADGNDVARYSVAQQLPLTVTNGSRATAVDFCTLRAPLTISVSQIGATKAIGEIWEENLTKEAGAPVGVVAEIGVGPADQDPGVSSAWSFSAAAHKGDVAGCAGCEFNDQFEALLPGSPAIGTGYVFRFQRDGGAWCYGDADGNGGNLDLNGFSLMTSNTPPAVNIGTVVE